MNTATHAQLERLLEVGRVDEARTLLGQAMMQSPDDPDLHVFAAQIARADGDCGEARQHLQHAFLNDPNHFPARGMLFHLECDEENYPQAEEVITGLIRDSPHQADLLAWYARLMLITFHLQKSRALVDEALRLDADDEVARLVDVLLSMVEGNRSRADIQLEELVADDPDGYYVAHTLLVSLIDQRRFRESLELAQQLLRTDPQDEALLETIIDLRIQTHWLALPLWPMQRFGWAASAGIWVAAVVVLGVARRTESMLAQMLALTFLGYVVYTWGYEPLMRRWVRYRGA